MTTPLPHCDILMPDPSLTLPRFGLQIDEWIRQSKRDTKLPA